YDDLLSRFGMPMPATGFGLDLDNLEWALRAAGGAFAAAPRARLCVGGPAIEAERLAEALRQSGADAAVVPERSARAVRAYATAWGYDAGVAAGRAYRHDGQERAATSARAIASWVAGSM